MPKQLTLLPAQVTGEGNGFAKWHKSLSSITEGTPGFKLTLLHTDNGSHTWILNSPLLVFPPRVITNFSQSWRFLLQGNLDIRGEDFVGQCEGILQTTITLILYFPAVETRVSIVWLKCKGLRNKTLFKYICRKKNSLIMHLGVCNTNYQFLGPLS